MSATPEQGRGRGKAMRIVGALVALGLVAILALALSLAWQAGKVPGQPEATRVPITPFADIPGFVPPTPVP